MESKEVLGENKIDSFCSRGVHTVNTCKKLKVNSVNKSEQNLLLLFTP